VLLKNGRGAGGVGEKVGSGARRRLLPPAQERRERLEKEVLTGGPDLSAGERGG